MEDYEEQEVEFWRKLEEADMSRSQMLKRSFAAAAGLTVLASPGVALGARRLGAANPPLKGSSVPLKTIVANAKIRPTRAHLAKLELTLSCPLSSRGRPSGTRPRP